MGTLVTYRLEGSLATITMDDGKVNVLSQQMFAELNAAFDRAEADGAAVLLAGRAGTFSGGFDLKVLMAGGRDAATLVLTGFRLGERILGFPHPVVVACAGQARAMGVFLILAGDYRIGADADYQIQANEVAIGITMPYFAVEMCRQRLTPATFNRAVIHSEKFSPADAVTAGFLDRIVPASDLLEAARSQGAALAALPRAAYAATKRRARATALDLVRTAIAKDEAGFRELLGEPV
jgi:enoyl-CoA hydratase